VIDHGHSWVGRGAAGRRLIAKLHNIPLWLAGEQPAERFALRQKGQCSSEKN
jgi:hypothetical protein